MSDALAALPFTTVPELRVESGAVVVDLTGRELRDRSAAVTAMPPGVLHLGPWRVAPGGSADEAPGTEFGLARGYARPDHDDSAWAGCSRVNEVSIGAPSWESDSFQGWIWYRGDVEVPPGGTGPGRLMLGSPTECRTLEWSVFLDGEDLTGEPVAAPVLELDVPSAALTPGRHLLAVRQRVTGAVAPDRRRELEGWRRIDVFCQQTLTVGTGFAAVELDRITVDAGVVTQTDAAGQWSLEARYAAGPDGVLKSSTLTRLGGPVTLSDVRVAEIEGSVSVVHPEGFWAGLDGGVAVAGADPAAVSVATGVGVAVRTWPGVRLGTGESVSLPPVFLGLDPDGDPRGPIVRLLAQLGRPRRDVSIYDPYGWYQISHASEPKVEVSDDLMGPISTVMASARELGITFDFLSLDCGWNDPDDLSRFHPASFPNGPRSVLDAVADNDSALMLWVSPSDGPRAFRHELGLVNPGFEGGTSQNPGLPWRLCPSFAPWRDTFRAALVRLVQVHGVRGFKLDGTELSCRADDHGHLPGLWSIAANVASLRDTFEAVSAAGASYLMLYWGLRSPWWLRWASTVWERGYLVEAAAPSGRASWTIRGSVMSSQDIGTTADWWVLPPHQQDSLGVWVSDTRWASHQGRAGWDDAMIMDAARGSRALQLWGDLRPLVGEESERLREVTALLRAHRTELDGVGRPIGSVAADSDGYGYAWRGPESAWVVVSRPGDGGETHVGWSELGGDPERWTSASIDYLSRDAGAEVEVGLDGLRVRQSGGSVVGVLVGATVGPTRIGRPEAVGAVRVREVSSDSGEAPDELLAPAYVGRVPHLANWMAGDVDAVGYDPVMLIGTPAEDRPLARRQQSWSVDVRADREAELAVVVRFQRDGAAWHHDLLHEIARLSVSGDDGPLDGARYPTFRHEQAGSWSWLRWTGRIGAGDHRLTVGLDAVCPTDLTTTLDVWLR